MSLAICPNNPLHDEFSTVATVLQEWKVTRTGEFLSEITSCLETCHHPQSGNIWECLVCGTEAIVVDESPVRRYILERKPDAEKSGEKPDYVRSEGKLVLRFLDRETAYQYLLSQQVNVQQLEGYWIIDLMTGEKTDLLDEAIRKVLNLPSGGQQ